ncbi:MAG: hypothetical protein HFF08_10270 [Oscillospiraceae bacterium]|nr:hypothetical protein [Oscillospiraceae bacterium]
MTKVQLLLDLKAFTEEVLKNETLPVREQKEDNGIAPRDRAPEVHLMRLPDVKSYEKRAPYVLHQVVTGHDGVEKRGEGAFRHNQMTAGTVVRSVFCVYDRNMERGTMALLQVMEQFRVSLLERGCVGGQFRLDLDEGISTMVYPFNKNDRPDPYYSGEMVTSWILPPVENLAAIEIASGGKRAARPL